MKDIYGLHARWLIVIVSVSIYRVGTRTGGSLTS